MTDWPKYDMEMLGGAGSGAPELRVDA